MAELYKLIEFVKKSDGTIRYVIDGPYRTTGITSEPEKEVMIKIERMLKRVNHGMTAKEFNQMLARARKHERDGKMERD